MKKILYFCYVFFILPINSVLAVEQTVTLSVPTMSCWVCPITVKKSLKQVNGVKQVSVSFKDKEAIVTFDNEKTKVKELTNATTNAGYPSVVKR
jgi:mercuric ion binding protein